MDTVKVEIFGHGPKSLKIISHAQNLGLTKSPVLIVGDPGVGKKSLARYIHEQSSRKNFNIVVVDCSQECKLVENAVLGYRDETQGKFIRGALETANGGTVIFANIDLVEENFQKRLHNILLELKDYDLDVRLIATTTKNLSKLVAAGRFQRGLYTMFAAASISLHTLKERREDIDYIAKYFCETLSKQLGKEGSFLNTESIAKLTQNNWNYNLTELKNVLEDTIMKMDKAEIEPIDLAIGERKTFQKSEDGSEEELHLMSLREAERLLIKKALIYTSENRTQAAKILGVSIRTLRNKINEYRNEGTNYFVNLR